MTQAPLTPRQAAVKTLAEGQSAKAAQAAFAKYLAARVPLMHDQQRQELAHNAVARSVANNVDNEGEVDGWGFAQDVDREFGNLRVRAENEAFGINMKQVPAKAAGILNEAMSGGIVAWFAIKAVATGTGILSGAGALPEQLVLNFLDPYSLAALGTLGLMKISLGALTSHVPALRNGEGESGTSPLPGAGAAVWGLAALTAGFQFVAHLWQFPTKAASAEEAMDRFNAVVTDASTKVNGLLAHLADPAVASAGIILTSIYAGARPVEQIFRNVANTRKASHAAAREADAAVVAVYKEHAPGWDQDQPPERDANAPVQPLWAEPEPDVAAPRRQGIDWRKLGSGIGAGLKGIAQAAGKLRRKKPAKAEAGEDGGLTVMGEKKDNGHDGGNGNDGGPGPAAS